MKANEAPEKLYCGNNLSYSNQPFPNANEYTSTDAFIEKAVVWISNNCYIPHSTLEDFKNYMKGE